MSTPVNKSSSSSDFHKKDLVFAKVRGHGFWPGQIDKIEKIAGKYFKYKVIFLVTNEVGYVTKKDICHYHDNKVNYPYEQAALKRRDEYKRALAEAEKLWDAAGLRELELSSVTAGNIPSPNQSNLNSLQSSTPLEKGINGEIIKNRSVTTEKICFKDASVNTSMELDLHVQLDAMTNRNIELEKSLMEIKNKSFPSLNNLHDEDFHTKILKQELASLKVENENLLKTLELLQNEKNQLERNLEQAQLVDHTCLNCFPPFQHNTRSQRYTKTSVNDHQASFESINPFDTLQTVIEDNPGNGPVISNQRHKISEPAKRKTVSQIANKTLINKSKLVILADSHGRDLSHLFEQKTQVNACSTVRANAKFCDVIQDAEKLSATLGKEDHLLVIGGTNNMESPSSRNFLKSVHSLISMVNHTNLVLATVPWRYDRAGLDFEIAKVNRDLEEIIEEHPNVSLLPLHHLPHNLYTSQGLHFSKRGKNKVVDMFTRMFLTFNSTIGHKIQDCEKIDKGKVTVVETNMKAMIDKMKNDPSVGFGHTVSSDFHMSAGVAVIFREEFGRPTAADYIATKLTAQRADDGATVFSLVTKADYWGKPTMSDYDKAFEQLTESFKYSGLKTLICSPMGCVRDLVQPAHFMKNLAKFQLQTGASVIIVSYYQNARRVLRNGLSHKKFLLTLRNLVDDWTKTSRAMDLSAAVSSPTSSTPHPSQTAPAPASTSPVSPSKPIDQAITPTVCSDANQSSANVSATCVFVSSPQPNTSSVPSPTLNFNQTPLSLQT